MKKVFYSITAALFFVPLLSATAKITFHTTLESNASVKREGGSVVGGGHFVPGVRGNGFISDEKSAVVHFPMHEMLGKHYLDEGTLECWLILGWDIDKFTNKTGKDEAFMFWAYNRAGTDAIGLMIGGGRNRPVAQFRVREVRNEWHNAVSAKLNWKEGETHHMAGTWGAAGLHLYLDGELAAQNRYKGGPANIIERLSINNNETDPAKFPTYSVVDELKIHDEQLPARAIPDLMTLSVEPGAKLAATWGSIKKIR